jgi:hypothetical protein
MDAVGGRNVLGLRRRGHSVNNVAAEAGYGPIANTGSSGWDLVHFPHEDKFNEGNRWRQSLY